MARRPVSRASVHAALLFAASAAAAAPAGTAGPPVELVPMIGVRGGADLEADVASLGPAEASPSPSFGLAVDVFVRPDGWFEASLDHQRLSYASAPGAAATTRFDLVVDYLQFGGGYEPQEGRVRPFVSASVGLTRYGASSGEVRSTIGASGSLGGGFRVPIGKSLSFRFDVRGYGTIADAAVSVACGPGCVVGFAGNGWYQLAARAGLAIRL